MEQVDETQLNLSVRQSVCLLGWVMGCRRVEGLAHGGGFLVCENGRKC